MAASSADDLRDNQLDELDSQVFADGISNHNSTLKNNDINNDNSITEHSDNNASNVSETTLKQIDDASVAPSKMASENSGSAGSAEMDYESVKGSKRLANDDGSSDDLPPSWEDVVVSEEVTNAAPQLCRAWPSSSEEDKGFSYSRSYGSFCRRSGCCGRHLV